MKKVAFLVITLFFLCGCSTISADISTDDTSAIPPADNISATAEVNRAEPRVIPAEMAKNKCSFYMLDTNWDADIYQDSSGPYLQCYILSINPITHLDLDLDIAVECSYSVEIIEAERCDPPKALTTSKDANVQFGYDTYLHYCGIDWSDIAEKYAVYQSLLTEYQATRDQELRANLNQAREAYEQKYNAYWDDYLLLDDDMLPQFHSYIVRIFWDIASVSKDESFNSITVSINRESQQVDIGEVRIHATNYVSDPEDPSPYLKEYNIAGFSPIPYLSETQERNFTSIVANQDLVITGCGFSTGGVDIQEMHVEVASSGRSADFTWDRKTPIEVAAGGTVSFYATFADPRLAVPGFAVRGFITVTYEVEGISHQHSYEHIYTHSPESYEVYAEHFDGINFTDYYELYLPYV